MLAVVLGDAAGAERDRVTLVIDHLPDAHVVRTPPRDATGILIADGGRHVRSTSAAAPVVAWVTTDVLLGRRPWPRADALLVPSSAAARAAVQAGFPRARVHCVGHPVVGAYGPALRSSVTPGSVAIAADPRDAPILRRMLERLPAVDAVTDIPRLPARPDDAFWTGPGGVLGDVSLVILAAVSLTGAMPAQLMARGIPLVAWNEGAAVDAIVDGLCGWLVRPTLPAAVAAARVALSDRWGRESAGIAARDRVLARNAPHTIAAVIGAAFAGVSECNPRVRHTGAVGAG